jgi:predicted DNA-binding protein YlxM (UPF0122 family)
MSLLPNRLGQSWSEKEIKDLLQEVQKKIPIELIADLHERTQGGIVAKLRAIAADCYLKKNLSISEIQKITSLSVDQISDAISKREIQAKWKEEKKTMKNNKNQNSQVKDERSPVIPSSSQTSETKEIISLLKDIKILLEELVKKIK